jgi:hypothetical protein
VSPGGRGFGHADAVNRPDPSGVGPTALSLSQATILAPRAKLDTRCLARKKDGVFMLEEYPAKIVQGTPELANLLPFRANL